MSVTRPLPSRVVVGGGGGHAATFRIQIQQQIKKATALSGRRALLEQLYSVFFEVLKAATYLIILTYDFPLLLWQAQTITLSRLIVRVRFDTKTISF